MVADSKGKKQKVSAAEKGEDENSQPDEELVLSIEKLQEIQDDLEKINEEASDRVLEVEQKYNERRKPVYDKRNGVIKSIPDFWLTAFLSHPVLNTLLGEEDQKIFKHLSSLDVEDSKDVKLGYSITFKFEPNPYFEETVLTKTFTFHDDGTTEVTVTPITWKEGMELPNGVNHEKKKGNKRTLSDESCFFRWFSDTKQDSMDEMQDEIADMIKEELWPNPLSYFNNEQDEEGFDGEEADDEDKEEDDSDEDDDEQDDDDDEEDDDEEDGDNAGK